MTIDDYDDQDAERPKSAKAVRVNLSVPPSIDDLLTELAKLSGRSKASWVMEAVGYQLPNWHNQLRLLAFDEHGLTLKNTVKVEGAYQANRVERAIKRSEKYEADILKRAGRDEDRKRWESQAQKPPEPAPPLSRQQRRALERQQRKKGNALDASAQLKQGQT